MVETISSTVFIGSIIVALTQVLKMLAPRVTGVLTVVFAIVIGIVVALLDTSIGLDNITVAQGILIALFAVGVHTTVTGTPAKPVV